MPGTYHEGPRRLQDQFDTRRLADRIDERDPRLGECPGAQLIVPVRVRETFPDCPRYIHKLLPVEPSAYVPPAGCTPPVPEWKRTDLARDVLPAGDPANPPGAVPPSARPMSGSGRPRMARCRLERRRSIDPTGKSPEAAPVAAIRAVQSWRRTLGSGHDPTNKPGS